MAASTPSLSRLARTAGYLLLGAVVTVAVVLALLYATRPVQSLVYGAVYLQVGPSEATETAVLTHVVAASIVALGAATLAGDYASDRLANRVPIGRALGAMAGLILVFLAVALAGLAAFLTAIGVLAVGLVGVPLVLRYRAGVRSGAVPAFVGGIPVVVLVLLVVGVGLGWGWGYVMTAEEVPGPGDGTGVPTFDEVPEVRDELFDDGNCGTSVDGSRTCRLPLRGSEHETAAVRFMARHGVRCPYRNDGGDASAESFVARHDGTYYRVTCGSHGD